MEDDPTPTGLHSSRSVAEVAPGARPVSPHQQSPIAPERLSVFLDPEQPSRLAAGACGLFHSRDLRRPELFAGSHARQPAEDRPPPPGKNEPWPSDGVISNSRASQLHRHGIAPNAPNVPGTRPGATKQPFLEGSVASSIPPLFLLLLVCLEHPPVQPHPPFQSCARHRRRLADPSHTLSEPKSSCILFLRCHHSPRLARASRTWARRWLFRLPKIPHSRQA
mmetsp:Transcript_13677/g.32443  ORF Transcript_13677/g.32443 Transcript_13677/m.32443 type:complete len:222 (-) Transcript_13677:666-1331(-)